MVLCSAFPVPSYRGLELLWARAVFAKEGEPYRKASKANLHIVRVLSEIQSQGASRHPLLIIKSLLGMESWVI